MKRFLALLLATSSVCLAQAETIAIVNVNVVPMTAETIVEAQTVVVDGDRITTVGGVNEVPVPDGAIVVDGTDRYLMPGLAEMHAHVPAARGQELDRVLTLFAVNGVTTIRGMLGRPSHLAVRDRLEHGELFGPRLVTSGPSLNGNSVNGAADAEAKVRAQAAAGYDFIKLHPGLTSDEFRAIAETAKEVGIPFAGHVPVAVGVQGALDAGMASIDHLDGYIAALLPADSDASGGYGGFFDVMLADEAMPGKVAALAHATASSKTWNVPTQSLFEHRVSDESPADMQNRPEMQYMPAATVRSWVDRKQAQLGERGYSPELGRQAILLRRRIILALHEAGARLLLGSDAPQVFNVPGFSLHQELGFLVDAGLTPFEAIATGTTAVAEFFGSNGGVVEEGRDADLVLLDANPLDDIENTRRVHGVVLRGRWVSRTDIEQRLDALRQRSN